MIPGLLAQDIAQSLREFIVTGFETETWPFVGKFDELVNKTDNGEAFIKGPYVSIGLPFLKSTDSKALFSGFETAHAPFTHQQVAWDRLRSDKNPQSTIVATGTGSGKTECFLYPLLDHCLRSELPGIKAIVIYPMNALASDQAKRFASVIHSTPQLKSKVRVGLFVGGAEVTDQKQMGPEEVITCKQTLRSTPPDILLTNYKMLDYLLMRPKDKSLWAKQVAESLQYLVVDELHTFDGAQGSDLAMLIRRLKARLGVQAGKLCCVGTSATLGSGERSADLVKYASEVFDTPVALDAIVGEVRHTRDTFLSMIEYSVLDPGFGAEQLLPSQYASVEEYLNAQVQLFFGEMSVDLTSGDGRVELGKMLKQHPLIHNLLIKTNSGVASLRDLYPAVQKQLPSALRSCPDLVLLSLLSLLAHARGEDYPGQPLVYLRLQLWARELRRIVSRVGDGSEGHPVDLHFSDDLKKAQQEMYLPVVQCNECHSTAWLTRVEEGEAHIGQDLRAIYNAFFASDKQTRVLLPLRSFNLAPPSKGINKHLCVNCGHLQLKGGRCMACQETAFVLVFEADLNKSVKVGGVPTLKSQRMCPVCQAKSSLILFGSRAASLSAVAIHQLFASNTNDDKKLIAFSDSVQDAAHRAGFFTARTWQNNIRIAMAQAVHSRTAPIPVEEFYNYLPRFWQEKTLNPSALSPYRYITNFLAPNQETHGDYLTLKQAGKLDNPGNLIGQIERRLVWETLQEFGIQSRIGRSLERTGTAALGWNPQLIEQAANQFISLCYERLGHSLNHQNAKNMLWGITLRMRRQGAVFHPLLDGYIKQGGDWFLLSRRNLSYMPDIGNYSILPRFPAEAAEKGLDSLFPKGDKGWYVRWVAQVADFGLQDDSFFADLLRCAMSVMTKGGLLLELATQKGNKVWALNPEHLLLYSELTTFSLRQDNPEGDDASVGCFYMPNVWTDHLEDLPSLDHPASQAGAAKTFTQQPSSRPSFYRRFYLAGAIERVIGHEHTSLLDRDYRESLENRFIASGENSLPWYENLLSATPTLEMGIDIGDLSSVLLCSVPPSQASFLQRAGRGGRSDGNAFVMTLANASPHDLYFYANPKGMMAGTVEAPAIFLNASMVLKRQLLAYCFDQWGMLSDGDHSIPGTMQPVLDAVSNHNEKKFPYTLLKYIKLHRDLLWEGFEALIAKQLSSTTRAVLHDYLLGTGEIESSIDIYVLDQLQKVVKERDLLVAQQKDLESELRILQKKPTDEALEQEIARLSAELTGIKRLKYELNRKETFNFLTDEGLLPNYAFPEEGTTLHSVIYRRLSTPRKNEDGSTSNFDSRLFEYSRPAKSALSELAPDSLFYASNRKVQIERVEMAKGENLEHWRLCANCNYSKQIVGADQDSCCPRCGDPMWANVSQLMPMVRLRQVYANTSEDDARIGDYTDTREPTFFNRQMLIDFDSDDITLAYAMKTETKPFGFEFLRKASFREINFGKQGGGDQLFCVAGRELARPGFRLCRECGTVQHSRQKSEHMFKCRYRPEEPGAGIIDCLYLYREYESEAIRILVPRLVGPDSEQQLQSFVAALQLGLKKRFGGKVDHIHMAFNDEPIPNSTERARYLVLYDAVPGGTGYLHELLANPDNLLDMLKLSRQVMAECVCQQDDEKDGCYQCLYAYRNSYGMEQTSRRVALEMLASILDENAGLERVTHLGKISKNPWVDSELEARFPDALQALSQHPMLGGVRVRASKDVIAGKVGFKLEVGERIYLVEIHARLNDKQGVLYPCEADYLIRPEREVEGQLPVAVFLDGYRYHKNTVQEDLLKRQGISLSRKYISWSLSWHDVQMAFAGNEVKVPNPFRENISDSPKAFIEKAGKLKGHENHHRVAELPPLLMLLKYLDSPVLDQWASFAVIRAMCWLNQSSMATQNAREQLDTAMQSWPSQFQDKLTGLSPRFFSCRDFGESSKELILHVALSEAAVKELSPDQLVVAVEYHAADVDQEGAQRSWQKLLQLVNVAQFLPNFLAATRKGLEEGSYTALTWSHEATSSVEATKWDDVLKQVCEELRGWLVSFASAAGPLPLVGYELEGDQQSTFAEAELAWLDKKVALLMTWQQEESRTIFESQGWTVMAADCDPKQLIDLLGAE
jgi:DEAD/DEAH box helicase domain-containing protein